MTYETIADDGWKETRDEFLGLVDHANDIRRALDAVATFIDQGRIDLAREKVAEARESAAAAAQAAQSSANLIHVEEGS